ncbi:MAG: protocatechuate 3,4-dioxygenase subunit beta [Granulosicoccus sp.]
MTNSGPLIPRNRAVHPIMHDPEVKTTIVLGPKLPLLSLESTLTEQTGPRFGHALIGPLDNNLIANFTDGKSMPVGERIRVHGRVLDENDRPVVNTLLEVWQANAGGRYRHLNDSYLAPLDPAFGGCGRTLTDDQGFYDFLTIKPGAYPWINRDNEWRPMHIHFSIFGHSFGQRLITQMYLKVTH